MLVGGGPHALHRSLLRASRCYLSRSRGHGLLQHHTRLAPASDEWIEDGFYPVACRLDTGAGRNASRRSCPSDRSTRFLGIMVEMDGIDSHCTGLGLRFLDTVWPRLSPVCCLHRLVVPIHGRDRDRYPGRATNIDGFDRPTPYRRLRRVDPLGNLVRPVCLSDPPNLNPDKLVEE